MDMHATSSRASGTSDPRPAVGARALLAGGSYVFFQRGSARFCAPVDDIQAIAEVGGVHGLPFRRKGILGVFMFRGRMALLCDPGAALALAPAQESAETLLAIVVAFPEGMVAFRVDRVSEVVRAEDLRRPDGEDNALTDWMDGYALQETHIAFLTTFDKLMRLLFDADLEGGLAAMIGSAMSLVAGDPAAPGVPTIPLATGAPAPEPAQAPTRKDAPKDADAAPIVKLDIAAIPPAAPRTATPARPAARLARAPAIRLRPARAPAARPLAFVEHRRIESRPPEPPESEPLELPIEPESVPETESIDLNVQAPIADTNAYVPPAPAAPVTPAPPVVAARVDPLPAPVAHASEQAPPPRRRFAWAAAAGVLLALALGTFLLPDRESGKDDARRVAPVSAAPAVRPEPKASPERPAEIAIIGKDFELRVERAPEKPPQPGPLAGIASPPTKVAPPPGRAGEIRHVVVRGDTLWAIAVKYLRNPYRYPELAQNSQIRNPNLIYPGDVVIIVRRR